MKLIFEISFIVDFIPKTKPLKVLKICHFKG